MVDTNTMYSGRRGSAIGLYKRSVTNFWVDVALIKAFSLKSPKWSQVDIFTVSASINNPMRSSLKKPKNKETASVASAASKKSVRIALGEEQTAV